MIATEERRITVMKEGSCNPGPNFDSEGASSLAAQGPLGGRGQWRNGMKIFHNYPKDINICD